MEISYQGKSLIKVNPLYHKHVYLNVSRHTLKHTMQKFQNIKTIGKTKEPKQPKRSRQKLSTTHRENQTHKQSHNFQTHVHFGRHGSFFCLFCFWFSRWLSIVFALTSLVVLVSLVFPMVLDIFKCTLDSSKRLGRGCAPFLNKAFTLHEFPYIRGFLV